MPVTWDLDAPPSSLLKSACKTASVSEVPSLREIRSSLMGSRFEFLKVSTFAAFLLAVVAIAIHGSRLANPDNQFSADAVVVMKSLADGVSTETAAAHGRVEAFAIAIMRPLKSVMAHRTAATVATSPSRAIPKTAVLLIQHAVLPIQHSLMDAPKHRKKRASHPMLLKTASVEANIESAVPPDSLSMRKNLVAPDSLMAGIIGLLLYILFAVVLVRRKGGLRAFSS